MLGYDSWAQLAFDYLNDDIPNISINVSIGSNNVLVVVGKVLEMAVTLALVQVLRVVWLIMKEQINDISLA